MNKIEIVKRTKRTLTLKVNGKLVKITRRILSYYQTGGGHLVGAPGKRVSQTIFVTPFGEFTSRRELEKELLGVDRLPDNYTPFVTFE